DDGDLETEWVALHHSSPSHAGYLSRTPQINSGGLARNNGVFKPQPRIVMPAFLPFVAIRPGDAVLSVVLILHLAPETMHVATGKSRTSTVVHAPSGQSSVVRR